MNHSSLKANHHFALNTFRLDQRASKPLLLYMLRASPSSTFFPRMWDVPPLGKEIKSPLSEELKSALLAAKYNVTIAATRKICDKYTAENVSDALVSSLRSSPLIPHEVARDLVEAIEGVSSSDQIVAISSRVLEDMPCDQFLTLGMLCSLLAGEREVHRESFAELVLLPLRGPDVPRADVFGKIVRSHAALFHPAATRTVTEPSGSFAPRISEGSETGALLAETTPPTPPPRRSRRRSSDKELAVTAGRRRSTLKQQVDVASLPSMPTTTVQMRARVASFVGIKAQQNAKRFPGAAGLEEGESKLGRVVREIFETEEQYYTQLSAFTQHYVQGLRASAAGKGGEDLIGLTRDEMVASFGALEPIVRASSVLLEFLRPAAGNMADGDAMDAGRVGVVGRAFVAVAADLVSAYSSYTSDHDRALDTIKSAMRALNKGFLKKRNSGGHSKSGSSGSGSGFLSGIRRGKSKKVGVVNFVKQWESVSSKYDCLKGQTLQSMLIMPVQRIPRYRLLLTELIKRTPADHAGRDDAEEALVVMKEVAASINDAVKKTQKLAAIFGQVPSGGSGDDGSGDNRSNHSSRGVTRDPWGNLTLEGESEATVRASTEAAAKRVRKVLEAQRLSRNFRKSSRQIQAMSEPPLHFFDVDDEDNDQEDEAPRHVSTTPKTEADCVANDDLESPCRSSGSGVDQWVQKKASPLLPHSPSSPPPLDGKAWRGKAPPPPLPDGSAWRGKAPPPPLPPFSDGDQ